MLSISIPQLLAYATALAVACAVPGPGVTSLMAKSLGNGSRAGFALLLGIIIGDLIYLTFAVFGLSLIASHFQLLFDAIRWGASLFLMYISWKFWTADQQEIETGNSEGSLFSAWLSGLALTLGNPKTIAFYLALLPLVIELNEITLHTWLFVLVPTTILVLLCVGMIYIVGAVSIRHYLSSKKSQSILYKGAAVIMFSTALSMFFK